MRLPGVAPGGWPSARTSVAGSHSAVKLQPRNQKGRERSRSRPMPFQQRTNTSCYLAIPTHGFTVVLSVFRGTPPTKPLKCKNVSNRLGARFRQRWTESFGGKPRLSCASIRLALSDIIKTSRCYRSQTGHLSLLPFSPSVSGKQKTLLTRGKQGVEIFFRFVTCLPPDYPSSFPGIARHTTWLA